MVKSRPEYRHGNVAEEALKAARKLLDADGLEAVSARKVANEIGVAHRALYNHFKDRADLLARLAALGFNDLVAALGQPQSAQMFQTVYLEYALKNPALYKLMMAQSNQTIQSNEALSHAVDALIKRSLDVYGNEQLSAEDNRRAVMRVWMVLHGGISLYFNGMLHARSKQDFINEMALVVG